MLHTIDLYRDDIAMVGYTASNRRDAKVRLQRLLSEHPAHATEYESVLVIKHTGECDGTCPDYLGLAAGCVEVFGKEF